MVCIVLQHSLHILHASAKRTTPKTAAGVVMQGWFLISLDLSWLVRLGTFIVGMGIRVPPSGWSASRASWPPAGPRLAGACGIRIGGRAPQ